MAETCVDYPLLDYAKSTLARGCTYYDTVWFVNQATPPLTICGESVRDPVEKGPDASLKFRAESEAAVTFP